MTYKACFICGTDTDVGKTIITSGLLTNLPSAQAIKVIQTGDALIDQQQYNKAAPSGQTSTLKHYQLAASPHLSARLEGQTLSIESLVKEVQAKIEEADFSLLEGSGGLYVPINNSQTYLDLIAELSLPVILVVKNGLGAINHCLASVRALEGVGVPILGLVFTHPSEATVEQSTIQQDNIETIRNFTQLPVLDAIPYIPELASSSSQGAGLTKAASYLKNTARQLLKEQEKGELVSEFDQQHLWHPYDKAIGGLDNLVVEKAKGAYLYLKNGNKLLDGMSSWWSTVHGYSHSVLVKALTEQAGKMSHVMFGGLTHDPAIKLGQLLLQIVPKNLNNIFFADSGSISVEVALKMALQYWLGKGVASKTKFISFMSGYHGDTIGAMSVCDPLNGMHTLFDGLLQQQLFVPRPSVAFDKEFDPESLNMIKEILAKHHHECAAVIIEPLVQGAGGMWIYHPRYLEELKKLCQEFNVLLIVDEIATGFGRTGKLFASNWANISPDIMCIGKALTGGTMTLAATITTREVAEGISEKGGVLMHGPTFMANPLACHVALASTQLLLDSNWQENVLAIEKVLKQELLPCQSLSGVKDVRVLGAIGVVEMQSKVNVKKLQQFFVEQCGVWIRPFNNLIYVMPPFICSPIEIQQLACSIYQAIEGEAWV